MANGFIKKNWQASAGQNALNSLLRIGGGIGASALFSKVFTIKKKEGEVDKNGKQVEDRMMYNLGGPLVLALSVLGDMMIEDNSVRSICQGMATVAGIHSLAVVAGADGNDPENFANKIGIGSYATMGAEETTVNGLRGVRGVRGVRGLGTTVMKNGTALGDGYATLIKKLQGNEKTVEDKGEGYNNDWGYIAKNIESAEQITKTVDGTPAEEAAALMGVASAEEAAVLMGMF